VLFRSTTRGRMAGRALALWECTLRDQQERVVSSHLVSVGGALGSREAVAAAAKRWQADALATARTFTDAGLRRVNEISAALDADRESLHQPGLFDRRVHFAQAASTAARDEALAAQRERADLLRRLADVQVAPPRLRLALLP